MSVIGAIAPQLERAEIARAQRQTDREPTGLRLLSSRPGQVLIAIPEREYRGA